MKLIIDIPEETYNDIQSRDWKNGKLVFSEEWKAIHNGTPLNGVLQEIRQEIEDIPSTMLSTSREYERGIDHTINRATLIIDNYIKRYKE